MDFLDPNKKRNHSRRLMLGYALMAIAVGLASIILLFVAYGYDLDRKTGKVIQNGLMFVNAHPEAANVIVNGKDTGKTDARLVLPAGEYTIELRRDGYRSWKRTINLEGSSIERLIYPVLFPNKLTSKELQTYAGIPAMTTQSPDRRWVLLQQLGTIQRFDELDTTNPKSSIITLSLPDGLLTASKDDRGLLPVEWSTDNSHVLIKHSFADKTEFIIFDRETPASSVNLNKQFSVDPTLVSLRDKKYDQYYIYDEKDLSLKNADLKAKTISPLMSGVTKFKPYKSDTVLYAAKDTADPNKLSVHIREATKDYIVGSLPAATPALLDIAEYDNHTYVVMASATSGAISIFRDPVDQLKTNPKKVPVVYSLLKLDGVSTISFSATAQFIAAQHSNHFALYDFEANRRYVYDMPFSISADSPATWMDGNRMLANVDNKLNVFDFNGINLQTLVPMASGTKPFFDRDYVRLFTLSPSAIAGKNAVQYTSLKVGQQ